ncbi:MAG: hypothetical protein KZQ83_07880 [gamma proteobacterium symbiont of Taylorina sp.]|nr:hypothetical protein [gamma proteobacterium symbiont of Taylorina sp.]
MSNPAVITLDDESSRIGRFKRFVLEDNIGESIHLHIDNMRVDFTINEFLEFSDIIRSSLLELDILKGFSLNHFDESFLKDCAPLLSSLDKIEIEEIELSSLRCVIRTELKYGLNQVSLATIADSPAYQYLEGNKQELLKYHQFNYLSLDNEQRLLQLLSSIKEKKYPYNNQYIVLFNGQNIIRDGQHRAAILAHLYGLNYKINIVRFYFHGRKHQINIYKSNLKNITLWSATKIFRVVKPQLKRIIAKIR